MDNLLAAWLKCHFGKSPKESPKKHPTNWWCLNQAGACCCPSCWGLRWPAETWGPPWLLRKCRNRPSCFHCPSCYHPNLLKFLWLDSHDLSLGKWLDRDNTSQYRDCSLYITCYFKGSFWGGSASRSSLCLDRGISARKYRQFVTNNCIIKFEYFQLPFISALLEAHSMYM